MIRGVRGAITVLNNNAEEINEATQCLLTEMLQKNNIREDDITSAFFSLTSDLNAVFPAAAARQMGWEWVPMMCFNEIPVPGSLSRCIRVLLHWETSKTAQEIQHVYLREAIQLRPDITAKEF